jgi:uncharacterized protein YdeI (YjbR/CyaY-like superfamily)
LRAARFSSSKGAVVASTNEREAIFFESAEAVRDWLEGNHDTADQLWIGFYKKGSGRQMVTYKDALDEALCFGWIDGVRKSLDGERYVQRFTPRRPRSIWSQVNIMRAQELIDQGRMKPAGLEAFEKREAARSGIYSYENRPTELGEQYGARFRENEKAWRFFQSQPPGYRRTATWWVVSAKQESTRLRRLDKLIADSEVGRRLDSLNPGKAPSD